MTVTTIGNNAFQNKNLISATIPDSVTAIGNSAFYNNQLTTLTIPDSITSIGQNAFAQNQLESLTPGSGLTSIPVMAFYANKITEVSILNSLNYIHPTAFYLQNPAGGEMHHGQDSPYYLWSDDPSVVQAAYDSIWYARLYTEDPSNPNNLQSGFMSEEWWGWI